MPFFFPMDSTIFLLLPALALAMYAQFKVKSTFEAYSRTGNAKGLTGAEVASRLLALSGATDVQVQHIRGQLTDHYDPTKKVVRLSDAVYGSRSLAAIGVAAHETGHALQHQTGYAALTFRNSIFPVVNLSSSAAMPLIIIGLLLSSGSGSFGYSMMSFGILLFSVVVLFQLVTLPVEFNASKRALQMLDANGILSPAELAPAKQVLSAAALTYVAAAAVSIANLLRFIMLLSRGDRR